MTIDRTPAMTAGMAVLMLLLAAAQIGLAMQVPLRYNAAAAYDEALFMQQAMHLVRGEWLGPYSALTLAKGPGFSLWLAAVHGLHLPVNLAAGLGWVCACALLVAALRPALPACGPRVVIFALVLFTPEALGDFGLLRELIYPTLVLAVSAAALGLLLRAGLERRASWPWALLLGLSSAALIVTREEGVLMAPLWGLAALSLLRVRRDGARAALSTLLLAAVAVALPLVAIAVLNQRHYGAFTLVEANSRPFTDAYGALTRVRHSGSLPQVPLPRENWARIAAVSPAFAALKPRLEGEVGARWFGPSLASIAPALEADDALRVWLAEQIDQPLPAFTPGSAAAHLQQRWAQDEEFRRAFSRFMGGLRHAEVFLSGAMREEIGGAFFVWALRDAAAAAGHHADAASARRFYAGLAGEVNAACERGALDCRSARSSLTTPLTRTHRAALPAAVTMATVALLRSENQTSASRITSMGEPAALAAAERFVHARLAPPHTQMAAAQPLETLIVLWRWALPVLATLALAAWLVGARRLWRPARGGAVAPADSAHEPQAAIAARRALWLAAALVLLLVLGRLAMVALIHVSGWPAAIAIRYLAPAQPLVVLFVALVLVPAAWHWRERRRGQRRAAPA